jgi:predicted ArsR family transcriptional regulator
VQLEGPADPAASFDRLVALCEPARRDLYFYVAARSDWVSRDEAADALGLRRGLVAHHLDRLAADGLLFVEYRRLTGRSGPGAGRPAKLYRRSDVEFAVAVPPRNPVLLGRLLAAAIARGGDGAGLVRRALLDVAREAGHEAGRRCPRARSAADRRRALLDLFTDLGYVPDASGGELSLANCPYEPVSGQDRALVCSMNLALVEGAVEGVGLRGMNCSLRAPEVARSCCVHVAPWPDRSR